MGAVADDLRSSAVPGPRDGDHVRGPVDAAVVLFYGDFACPRCVQAWDRLAGAPVRLVFRHFALKTKHPRAVALACAAEAAGRQGAFFAWADARYADPGRIDDPHLWASVRALGLDLDRFETDRRSEAVIERVRGDVRDAMRAGATATPTLFVDGVAHAGPPGPELLAALRPGAG